MTELQFYKYLKGLGAEMHVCEDAILLFLFSFNVEGFCKFISSKCPGLFDDGGLDATMKDNYIVIDITPICDYNGINKNSIIDLAS